MSIASEITRLQTSKADIKTQVNIDVDDINEGTDFINDETLDDYADLIENMQDAYKQYIPIHTKMIAKGNITQEGTPTPSSPIEVNNVTGEQVVRVCGKNILPQDKYINNTTINGITFANNRDGTFNVSGTATANTSINIIPVGEIELETNQPYYLYSSIPYNVNTFNLSITMKENNKIKYLTANNTYTPTTTPTQERLDLWIPSGVSVNIQNAKIMLVKGSTRPTEYEKYQGKDYEINLGKNLYEGSQDFSGTWINESYWSTADETYNGLVVKYRQSAWNGIMKEIDVEKNGVYTFSFFGKKSASGTTNVYLGGGVGATPSEASFNLTTEWQRFSITFVVTTAGKLRARVENSNSDSNTYICGYQLEKNKTMTSYSPYFTPIELNKIGNYQDFIKKGTGKNIADISQAVVGKAWSNQTNTQRATILYIPVKKGTNYSLVSKWTNSAITNIRAVFNLGPNDLISNVVPNSYPYSNTQYDYASIEIIANTTFTSDMLEGVQIILCEGIDTTFEPYGYKDKWYIEKNVGKVVLNGSESCSRQVLSGNIVRFMFTGRVDGIGGARQTIFSNYFAANLNSANDREGIGFVYENLLYLYKQEASVADFQTWLNTHNTSVYYVLNAPEYTLIENEELIKQLEAVQLQTGKNNVLVSGDLPMILDLSKYIQIVENHL